MKVLKLEKTIYAYTHFYLGGCPYCGKFTNDRRYRSEARSPLCHVYRSSQTSVTMRCKNCRLRFTVTWKAMIEMFKNLREKDRNNDNAEVYDNIIEIIKLSTSTTSPDGQFRRN